MMLADDDGLSDGHGNSQMVSHPQRTLSKDGNADTDNDGV